MKLDVFSIVWNLGSLIITVLLHSIGTVLIVTERPVLLAFVAARRKVVLGQFVLMIIVIELMILHLIEVAVWGICLYALGLFATLKSSIYFAGISYTSLGYSGNLPSARIGLSEVFIAMVGLLMFGWSIGILVTTVVQYDRVALGFDPTKGPA
jgi:hypothetical protein